MSPRLVRSARQLPVPALVLIAAPTPAPSVAPPGPVTAQPPPFGEIAGQAAEVDDRGSMRNLAILD